MNRSEWKAILGIALLYIFRMLGLFMVLPLIGLAAGRMEGATPALIGLALGIYGLAQACLQIPFGMLSDRVGRKPMIAGGLVLFIAGSMVAATADSMQGIILGRALQGSGAIASVMLALLADLTRVEQRTKAMAGVGMSIGMSFGLALVIGPLIHARAGLAGVFWVTALLGLVGMAILLFVIPTPAATRLNRDAELVSGEVSRVLGDRQLLRVDLGIFLLHYNLMSSFVVFPMLLAQSGRVGEHQHWLVYLSVLTLSFILATPLMRLADRARLSVPVMSTGIAIFGVAFLLLHVAGARFWWVWTGMLIFFLAFNLLEITLPSLLSKMAHAGTRGTAMGIYSTGQFLGAFCGGAVGGWILEIWGISALFAVNGALVLMWLTATATMRQPPQLSSRTLSLAGAGEIAAISLRDALLSVQGVTEVVIIEAEKVAYLKVDDERFRDEAIADLDALIDGAAP